MKKAHLVLTIIALGAWAPGPIHAAEPTGPLEGQRTRQNPQPQRHPGEPTHGNPGPGSPGQTPAKHLTSNAGSHAAEKSAGAGPLNLQAKRPSMNDPHAPGLAKAPAAAKDGLAMNKMETHREQLAKLEVGGRTAAPLPHVVRDAGAAASLGGSAASSPRNPAAGLNGTGIKRRP
jgi:hypothetical protein